ncbi:hypothetical protein BV22DRAFT_1100149 [Leucogyrophana mollusca]|uniref:Uncharacterized protein n=1 Tax=Leucogyrophana mollusca TaxID=85980 RepID=A0ACB8B1R4_9AGAM|nr:hypothetical protein BV22DRAFT_1100149 [Leucogyrophana mollusca]
MSSTHYEAQPESNSFLTFKDCFARRIISQPGFDDADLDDFTSYLAFEAWGALSQHLRDASYETRSSVPDIDSISIETTPHSVTETLTAYGLASDSESCQQLMRKIVEDYIKQACAPPPVWSTTRTIECEICEREVPLTYHHLIPRSTHAKVLKKKMHPESIINSVAWLCRPCHTAVHHMATNDELARSYHTVELLLGREDIQKWRKYAARQRWGVRRG